MPPSLEQLLDIARNYWPSDKGYYLRQERSPEMKRLQELREQELKKLDRWWAFLAELERALPGFDIGDATGALDTSFGCTAYPSNSRQMQPVRWAVVGCVSILAPVYTIYGLQYEYSGTKRIGEKVFFEPLSPEMHHPSSVIARKIEETFGVSVIPHSMAETPVPLFVEWNEPPYTTLFHALFASQPERVP
jgi:hypothetical protein